MDQSELNYFNHLTHFVWLC